jgi:Spy/CpxP family protein refolding chaperone
MSRNGLILILIASLAVNAAGLGTMGYHYYRRICLVQPGPCPLSSPDNHLHQSLGLSKSQLARIEPLAHTFHAGLAEMTGTLTHKRDRLVELLNQERIDYERIESTRIEIAAAQDQIQQAVIIHILDLKKILKPEQQQHFFNLMREHLDRGEGSTGSHTNTAFGTPKQTVTK